MESAPAALSTRSRRPLAVRHARLGDERLANMVGDGRERAFAAIYDRYHQPLYRYCRSLLRNDADAQDVLQSTFTSAFVALRAGRRSAPLRPWMFRIAHNEAVSMLRRRRGTHEELSDSVLPPVPSAAEEADERERTALLIADLAELPERQRSALLMRELNGLPHAEIAVVLGTSVGAAKQAIFDGRTALLELAEGRAMACDDIRRKISARDGRALRGRRVRAHLRDCAGCAAFAASISARRHDLQALAPMLPAGAAAGLFARVARGASASGAGGGAGSAATAGVFGKLGGATLASKTIAVAVVATTAAGVSGLTKVLVLDRGVDRSTVAHGHGAHLAIAHSRRSTVAVSAFGGRHDAGTIARSQQYAKTHGRAFTAVLSIGQRGSGRHHVNHATGATSSAVARAGIPSASAHASTRGHSKAAHGQSTAGHGGSARHVPNAGTGHARVSHGHATGRSSASHGAGEGSSTSNQTAPGHQQHSRSSGTAPKQHAVVVPSPHPAPTRKDETTSTTPAPQSHGSSSGDTGKSGSN